MTIKHAKPTVIVGAGRLFFQETDSSGNAISTGFDYLGDSPGFSLNVASENLEDWSSDGPIAEKLLDIAIRVNRNFSLQTKNVSFENMGRFVIGDLSTYTQVATPVVAEPYNNVKVGQYLQLGRSTGNPLGASAVTSVSVVKDNNPAPPTLFVENTDYELDAATAMIRLIPGGAIVDGDDLMIDYTPVAGSTTKVSSSSMSAKYGRLLYKEDASFGPNRDLVAPLVQLKPNGEFATKSREAVQQMGWDCTALSPISGESAITYRGRVIA